MSIHQYITTHGTLEADLPISTRRVKVLAIHVSNRNSTQTAVVSVEDVSGNVYMEIACPPHDSRTVSFAEATDFQNGLVIDDAVTDGNLIHVTVAHSRSL